MITLRSQDSYWIQLMIGLFLLVLVLLILTWAKMARGAYLVFFATIVLGLLVFWHHITLALDINL